MLKQNIKLFIILLHLLMFSGCFLHTTHIAEIGLLNQSNSKITAQIYLKTHVTERYTLPPGHMEGLLQYEEHPEEHDKIPQALLKIELTHQSGCTILLERQTIQKIATRKPQGYYWIIPIVPELFEVHQCYQLRD